MKPINPFPMIMMLIIVLLLMAWLGAARNGLNGAGVQERLAKRIIFFSRKEQRR